MSAALILIFLAGTAGSFGPEPTRTLVASSARAGVTIGAMYFVVGSAQGAVPATAVPPPSVQP